MKSGALHRITQHEKDTGDSIWLVMACIISVQASIIGPICCIICIMPCMPVMSPFIMFPGMVV